MDQNQLENIFKEHLQSDQRRLDRIEEKIDKLAEFVVQLARVEEKLESLEHSRDKMGERIGVMERNELMLQNTIQNQEKILSSLTKLFWTGMTTLVSSGIGAFFFL